VTEHQPIDEIPERAYINTADQVEALNSTFRIRILKAAGVPRSVREIADKLGVPITRLYYHVNLLEEAGFLNVVDSRKSGARIEKIYLVAARSFTPGPELRSNVTDAAETAAALAGLVVGPARVEAEMALRHRLEGEGAEVEIARATADLTPGQFETIKQLMDDILHEFTEGESSDPAAIPYTLTFLLLPTDST